MGLQWLYGIFHGCGALVPWTLLLRSRDLLHHCCKTRPIQSFHYTIQLSCGFRAGTATHTPLTPTLGCPQLFDERVCPPLGRTFLYVDAHICRHFLTHRDGFLTLQSLLERSFRLSIAHFLYARLCLQCSLCFIFLSIFRQFFYLQASIFPGSSPSFDGMTSPQLHRVFFHFRLPVCFYKHTFLRALDRFRQGMFARVSVK